MTEIKAKKVIFKNRDGEYLLPMTEDKTGLVLFDTILKDHILTYEESKGLALQGTYVYKEAIAGSRYGYADFYNKCIEELNNSSNEQRYLKSNITKVGSVVDNQGVLSGFSASNYATTPIAPTTVTSYEWVCKFTVGNNITTQQGILANLATNRDTPQIFVSEDSKIHFLHPINASTWSSVIYTNLTANTTYWVKATWDGSTVSLYYKTSSNGTYALAGTTSASTINWTAKVGIGIDTPSYPFLGSIDLKESYININGERWWTGVDSLEYKKNPNGHLFYDITQKDIVDDLFEQTGMAWFYGIDQENERIFLPRNNYFEQATADVSEINTHVEAGLPDHYHTVTMKRAQKSGQGTKTVWSYAENDQGYGTVTSDLASVANPIYSNSDTVQPNAVKKLLYICVGNTVADTSWVNVVTQVANGAKDIEDKRVQALTDLTNKENAGLSALANASNALRTTQITNCITEIPQSIKYNLTDGVLTVLAGSKFIIPDGYDSNGEKKYTYHIANRDITVSGGLIFEQSYIVYDVDNDMFWDIATSDKTSYYDINTNLLEYSSYQVSFPIMIVNKQDISSPIEVEQIFNGMGYIGSTFWIDKGVKGLIPNGINADGSLNNIEFTNSTLRVNTVSNYTNQNMPIQVNNTSTGWSDWLYIQEENPNDNYSHWYQPSTNILYYAGATVGDYQKVNQLVYGFMDRTAGQITGWYPKTTFRAVDYNDIAGLKAYITETYVSGLSWYRIWSDGWCEQGGGSASSSNDGHRTTTVTLLKPFINTNYSISVTTNFNVQTSDGTSYYHTVTKTGFKACICGYGYSWRASGYIA